MSESEDVADLGGDVSSIGAETRSYGFRVRRIGLLTSVLAAGESSLVCFGSVRAQFSQGIALLLSFSS